MIPNFTFTLGYVFDSLLSYLLPDWRDFTLALSILTFPFILLWPLWPKSPRWLFSVGRAKEGQEVVKLFAKFGSKYSFYSYLIAFIMKIIKFIHTKLTRLQRTKTDLSKFESGNIGGEIGEAEFYKELIYHTSSPPVAEEKATEVCKI